MRISKPFLTTTLLIVLFVFTGLFAAYQYAFSENTDYQQTGIALPIPKLDYVHNPKESLNLTTLNVSEFTPRTGIKNQNVEEFFNAKDQLDLQSLFNGLAEYFASSGEIDKARSFKLIAENITPIITFEVPAHKYKLGPKTGNRLIYYGADNDIDKGPGHQNLDRLVHDVGMPVFKIMTHFNAAQGGAIKDVVAEGNGGMTHAGSYYEGFINGKPVAVRSDWPANYGALDDEHRYYNAHLFTVDYQAATKKNIPQKTLKAYYQNFALWDVLTGLNVKYATESKYADYKDYTNNPLEAYDQKTFQSLASAVSKLNPELMSFTTYCAEGQWYSMNLAPNYLIQKGRYPQIDKFIATFQKAPEYQSMQDLSEKRKHPEYGWNWLEKNGLLSDEQIKNLNHTSRKAVFLDWVSNDVQPWSIYQPQRADGLVADPMSLGSLARMLLRTYFPRARVAQQIQKALTSLYQKTSDNRVKQAIEKLTYGFSPDSFIGEKILHIASKKLSVMLYVGLLQNRDFKDFIYKKLGYQHIVTDEDRHKVDQLYNKYITAVVSHGLDRNSSFDAALATLDEELSNLSVEMKVYGPGDHEKRTHIANVPFFKWAPPQAWAFWAKHPELFHSKGIRYVATAMHYSQSNDYHE